MGNSGSLQKDGNAIDPRTVEALEARARDMAAKIDELEKRLEAAAVASASKPAPAPAPAPVPAAVDSSSAQLTAAYVNELQSLREVLVDAEREHQELLDKLSTLEAENEKLEYRVKHLKRNCATEA